MIVVGLYLMAAFYGLAALAVVSAVGKEREPLTAGTAATIIAVQFVFVFISFMAAETIRGYQ